MVCSLLSIIFSFLRPRSGVPGQKAVCPLFPPVLYHTALAVARLFCNFSVKIAAVNLSIFSKNRPTLRFSGGFSGPDGRCPVIGTEFCDFPVKSGGQKRPGPALARVSSWGGGARDSQNQAEPSVLICSVSAAPGPSHTPAWWRPHSVSPQWSGRREVPGRKRLRPNRGFSL